MRKQVAHEFIMKGHSTSYVLHICGLSPSQYYQSNVVSLKPKGRPPTQFTTTKDGGRVANTQVIEEIKALLAQDYVDYGYQKTTQYLCDVLGYRINRKKVYRLMKSEGLILGRGFTVRSPRTFVRELLPKPTEPFSHIQFDIKYVHIQGIGRNAMLLTAIDAFSRYNIAQILEMSIKQDEVIALFEHIVSQFPLAKNVTVRSDNGSQFTAQKTRKKLEELAIKHEFTLPATPEQNAYIESYHSVVERAVCRRYEFENLKQAQEHFYKFREFYNNQRLHSGINMQAPVQVLANKGFTIDQKGICHYIKACA